jgi:hydrogenase maturation protein HypF
MIDLAYGEALPHSTPPLEIQERKALELVVHGVIQGVGFRPFVYRLAKKFEVCGSIANTGQGVIILAEGAPADLDRFIHALSSEAPPLSRITSVSQQETDCNRDRTSFTILKSRASNTPSTMVPADIALCDECRQELLNPADRRYRYPFINCTNCGPRFTIVNSIPYDRPGTSMAPFPMCASCQAEYDNPDNRRFHAQPNACHVCGPQISWHARTGEQLFQGETQPENGSISLDPRQDNEYPLTETIKALNDGLIVAIRGIGGFHLVVDAGSEAAVTRLRQRKHRKSKPLAVMMPDLEMIGSFCHLTAVASQVLTSPAHPIVLLTRRETTLLAPSLAPGMGELGVMLPYTPLHHLLFATAGCPKTLVMTSGNHNGEPLCAGNDEAVSRLGSIADYFLLHNREIVTRIDDSVMRIMQERPRCLRRARGFAPASVALSYDLQTAIPPLLACGSAQKNTFCLVQENKAYVSQHIGDMVNIESLDFFKESIYHVQSMLRLTPQLIVCDLHPDYLSSAYGRELAVELNVPRILVQHHHAHAVAVMAEHGLKDPVLAIVLDGTGLGSDGTIWGGEILEVSLTDFIRRGCLDPLPLPGGDAAAHQPWRMGLAALHHTGEEALLKSDLPVSLQGIPEDKRAAILTMIRTQFNTPLTSSCGRLFDAVAALLGIRLESEFEGQAAMELEALCAWTEDKDEKADKRPESWSAEISQRDGLFIIENKPFIHWMLHEMENGTPLVDLARDFHRWLIASFAGVVQKIAKTSPIRTVVLAGGCLQNRIIMEGLFQTLEHNGFQVYTGEEIPVNDGGISLGQAVIGGLRYVSGSTHEGY